MVNKPSIPSQSTASIALGSNLFIPLDDLKLVPQFLVDEIGEKFIKVESVSQFYKTPAFPAGSGPDFINAAFCISTSLNAHKILAALHEVEAKFGRERPYRWSPRSLDLDLIFCDEDIFPDKKTWHYWASLTMQQAQLETPSQLILPHPRAHERSFVLGPLKDIQPEKIHPVLKKTVHQLWMELPANDQSALEAL